MFITAVLSIKLLLCHETLVALSRETGGGGKGTGIPCGRGAGKGRESISNSPIPDIFCKVVGREVEVVVQAIFP